MKDTSNLFAQIASSLIGSDVGGELPDRYLTLRKRRGALQSLIREAREAARKKNALAKIRLRIPLSVAGELSIVIVRAEGLQQSGIPIATELDAQGKHRGTPLADVLDMLKKSTGWNWPPESVLDEYQRLLCWLPEIISSHPKARYSKIPRLLRALDQEIESLELRLKQFIQEKDQRIFSVALDPAVLAASIESCLGESVTVGFHGVGSKLTIDSNPGSSGMRLLRGVPVRWGFGSGLAVLSLQDLRSLPAKHGDLLVLNLDRECWEAWIDSASEVMKIIADYETCPGRRFEYFHGAPSV